MWSARVTVFSCLALLAGCLKPQPVVNAPIVLDIAPVTGKVKEPETLPVKLGFTVDFTAPPDWSEIRRPGIAGRVFRFRDEQDILITVHVLPDFGKTDSNTLTTEFRQTLEASGYEISEIQTVEEPYETIFRFCRAADTPGEPSQCGQRFALRPSMVPDILVVATGEWPELFADRGSIDLVTLVRSMKVVPVAKVD